MVIYKNKVQLQKSWPAWRYFLTGLNLLALVLSAIMSWHYLAGGSMAGCGGGSPCEQVLNSRWSTIAGILPVSGLAMGVYLSMLVAVFFIGPGTDSSIRKLAWFVLLILAGAVTGSAIWFTILQKWIIGSFCFYCMTMHITGLLLSGIIILKSVFKSSKRIINPLQVTGLVLTGLFIAGALAISQIVLTSTSSSNDTEYQNNLPAIDYKTAPIIGSPDAPYIVTLLFDYECSHCQKIHFMLNEAVRQYDGKLAFALCPTPLNRQCNPYVLRDVDAFNNSCELAKIGLSVWKANPEVFPVFEDWMFSFESGDSWFPRSPEAAKTKAAELVSKEKFEAALSDPWIKEYLKTSVQIFGQTLQSGKGGIPKMIYGSYWVIPEPYNANDLVRILQKNLPLPNS
ncbi:MAG: thioredoxin domain-containing protein [Bacteroidales bacterium]|nr:thioredoxin domain-containing protein [Bacteroidales bacterium]MBN2774660.1 thioredoxin domain-containing protein [Prolixibacteraceae bacterium]